MGAFLGISLWIALATVIPGLVSITTLYTALVYINPQVKTDMNVYLCNNDWIITSMAVTIMVLTQAAGILLEKFIIDKNIFIYTPDEKAIDLEEGIIPDDFLTKPYDPYNEYKGLYLLIARLTEHEDTQGHLKRVLAQFFLTNNTLVSFLLGIITGIVMLILRLCDNPASFELAVLKHFFVYEAIMVFCFCVSFHVARIRFNVMGKSLLAARFAHIEFKCELIK